MRTNPVPFVHGEDQPSRRQDVRAVPDGPHRAELLRVYPFANAYGARVMFEFRLTGGDLDGGTIVHSAAPTKSPHGKLAETVRGLVGREPTESELLTLDGLVGRACTIIVRTVTNRSGKSYPSVIAVTT